MSEKPVEVLSALANDDEHTGADGAYTRMLKARKWLYLTSTLAVLHAYKLIDLVALKKLTGGVITLPSWLLTNAVLAGLAYLLFQYGVLLFQLAGSYGAVIAYRLPDSQRTDNAKLGLANTKILLA